MFRPTQTLRDMTGSRWSLVTWVIMSTLFLNAVAASCDQGWFGDKCQYKCRCQNDSCDSDGSCKGGATCQGGWFGPACQYSDIAYNKFSVTSLSVAVDGNDSTCLNGVNFPSINFNLSDQFSFTWLRVRLGRPELLSTLVVGFGPDGIVECKNSRNTTVDSSTMDVYCDTNQMIQYIHISGDGINYMCSLYVSGGRNVALKQNASQTSVYGSSSSANAKNNNYTANNSVDGNQVALSQASCSVTSNRDPYPSWNVSFLRPQTVARIVIYNRAVDGHLLTRFTLQAYDKDSADRARTFIFNDNQTQITLIYYIQSKPFIAQVVSITATNGENWLQVCEVEVYGDSICESDRYGRDCEYRCNCTEPCFVSTGGCPSESKEDNSSQNCNSNTYGTGCAFNCSQFCVLNSTETQSCDHINGTCIRGCVSGYSGLKCQEACSKNTYGPGCAFNCSQFCVQNSSDTQSCDHTNGTCINGCVSGYRGRTCQEPCTNNTHGQGCAFNCSQFCVRKSSDTQSCDHINGTCINGCVSGYKGLTCEEQCCNETYGPGCTFNCSQFCGRNTSRAQSCDPNNGTCMHGCVSGYRGLTCKDACTNNAHGPGCTLKCSEFCVQNSPDSQSCDHVSGACLHKCVSGYMGQTCQEPCNDNIYGPDCNYTCSQFCVKKSYDSQSCDHVNGTCRHGCIGDYKGFTCQEHIIGTTEDKTTVLIAVCGLLAGICSLLVLVLLTIYVRRRLNTRDNTTEKYDDIISSPIPHNRRISITFQSQEVGTEIAATVTQTENSIEISTRSYECPRELMISAGSYYRTQQELQQRTYEYDEEIKGYRKNSASTSQAIYDNRSISTHPKSRETSIKVDSNKVIASTETITENSNEKNTDAYQSLQDYNSCDKSPYVNL